MLLVEFPIHFSNKFPVLLGQKVLVALSGGPDSVALLHLMTQVQLELEAAHIHHGVRGTEADEDAAFCRETCNGLQVPFHLVHLPSDAPSPDGRECSWRKLRYAALFNLASEKGLKAIATGHHRDDVAEGVLVQLLRGGGPKSLAGIAGTTPEGVIRPLLPWSRDELLSWLEEHKISWRHDSSNTDRQHLRNRVRHDLLPLLEEASPSLRSHLVHLAGSIALDEEYLAGELASQSKWIDPWEPEGGIQVAEIQKLAPPLRNRWLHAQAQRIGLSRVSRRQLGIFEQLVSEGNPRAVTLGQRWRLRIARGCLWLEPPQPPSSYSETLVADQTLDLPLPGWKIRLTSLDQSNSAARWRWRPPAKTKLHVRSIRSRERLEIDGTAVSVASLLAKKLPRHLRGAWPLLCGDDRIYWIPGVWQDPVATTREGQVVEVIRR